MNNKKRITSLLIALTMLLAIMLSSCSSEIVVAEYEGVVITSNMFSYMLSSQKANIEGEFSYYYYYNYGSLPSEAELENYWKSIADPDNDPEKTTAQAVYENMVNAVKTFAVLKHLCDKYNIEITDQSTIDAIESYMQEDILTAGDENLLNIVLSRYGATVDIQREYLNLTSKVAVLFNYLYGDNGIQRISEETIRKEFDEKYEKIEFVNFSFYDYDDEGNSTLKKDETITDEQLLEEFENEYYKVRHILYYYYDNKIEISETEKQAKREAAAELYEKIQSGEMTFDEAVEEGPDEPGLITKNDVGGVYGRGKLITDFDDSQLFEMEVGEVSLIESEIGTHIFLKVEKTEDDFTAKKEEINKSLVIKNITAKAEQYYADLQDGKVDFATTEDGAGVLEEEPIIYTEGDFTEKQLLDIIDAMENGDYGYADFSSDGVYIIRKSQTTDDDYEKLAADLRKYISENKFYEYLESFHPMVKINQAEIDKYDMLTVKSLTITAME